MLITPTFADSALNTASQTTMTMIPPQFLPIIGMVGVFYFLILRPQAQRQKEKQELLSLLKKGDVIYTNGGIVGKVIKINEIFCLIEVSANTQIYIQKEAIVDWVPQGSLKSLGFE